MTNQILVPLSSYRRIEEVMPYVRDLAKTGTRVVFLIRYPLDYSLWLKDHWITTESPREAMLAGRLIMERHSPVRQRELAEERLAPWRQTLQNMGVEATVDIYSGSLASVVKRYSRARQSSLIMRAQNGFAILQLLRKAVGFLGLFKRAAHRPVLLFRPGQ